MWNSLRVEWLIWSQSRLFWTAVFLIVVGMAGFPYMVYKLSADIGSRFAPLKDAFNFPFVFNTIGVLSLLPVQIASLLVVIIVCQDFEHKTYRLHILNGVSKPQLWFTKVCVSLVLSILTTLIALLLSLAWGIAKEAGWPDDFPYYSLRWLLLFAFQSFAFMVYGVFFGVLIRKAGLAVMLYMIWFGVLERTISQVFNFNFHWYPFFSYLPGKSVEEVTYLLPLRNFIIRTVPDENVNMFFALFWLVLLLWVGYQSYRRVSY